MSKKVPGTCRASMTREERLELLSKIQPRLAKIGSAHESSWIADFIQNQPNLDLVAALKVADQIIQRRELNEPLAYIFGSWSFRSHEFLVGPGVLIPRPETEELVEAALMSLENSLSTSNVALDQELKIVDLGAGSGCVGISLVCDLLRDVELETGRSREISKKYLLTLVENSKQALPYLKKNIEAHREKLLGTTVKLYEGSWEEWPTEKCHLLLSNPPYLTESEFAQTEVSVKNFEPKSALVPTDIQTEARAYGPYKKILNIAENALVSGGWIWLELGQTQPDWIQEYAKNLGCFNDLRMMRDMARKYRFFCARKI